KVNGSWNLLGELQSGADEIKGDLFSQCFWRLLRFLMNIRTGLQMRLCYKSELQGLVYKSGCVINQNYKVYFRWYYRPTVQQRKQAVFHLLGIPLASKPEMNSYVKIHPKVSHGWTVRYSIDDPEAVKAAEEAHKEMLDWFVTYVK
ncbi:unnamed protein product, partial [Arabidopsis halleri]